jgi:hypothetical protein
MEKKKEILKIIIRCIAFAVVFVMLFNHATDLLMRHDDESDEIHAFYSEPENSIDVLYVGSSPLLRGVSPMAMWNEHGFTGYVRASALQAPAVSYGLLAESLEYQSPELVVLLCDNIFNDYDYVEREGDLRRGLDGMKMSKYKFDIIREVTAADERQSLLSYVFPLMRYHDRWKEIDLVEDEPTPLMEHSFKKGNVYLRDIAPQVYPENFMEPTGAEYAFDDSAKGYIEKSIALCKEKDIPVLLLHLPKMSWSYEQSMMMQTFADTNGVAYLDLDRWEYRSQLGLDPSVDYYDQGHMNLTGVLKLSDWLGDWLDAQYDLPDHKEDAAISENWNADLALYKEKTGLQ